MKTENVLNALTGGIVVTWLASTEYGVFFLAAVVGVLVLAVGILVLSYLFSGADNGYRWAFSRARTLPKRSPRAANRPALPRVAANLMKRA